MNRSLGTLKRILTGKWQDEGRKNKDKNIFFISRNPFPTAVQIADDLKGRIHEQDHMSKYLKSKMGFLKGPELNHLLIRINSALDDPNRAAKILEKEAGRYFNELRDLCADENLPIPDYYVPKMTEYIEELRKRVLI